MHSTIVYEPFQVLGRGVVVQQRLVPDHAGSRVRARLQAGSERVGDEKGKRMMGDWREKVSNAKEK